MERDLRALIGRVRGRWLKLVALRTAARACALAALPIVVGLAVDGAFQPHGWLLLLLAAAVIVLAVAAGALPVFRARRRPDDRLVARYIEERAAGSPGGAHLDDALVSAVDVAEGRIPAGSPAFTQLIVAAAVRRLQGIDPAVVVEPEALRKAGLEAAAGVLALAIVVGLGMPSLRRAGETAWMAAFPDTVHVEVQPGDVRVVAGQPLRITTKVQGTSGPLTGLAVLLTVTAGDEHRTVEMTRHAEEFRYEFASVDRSFRYKVTAGTAASAQYTVAAAFPPHVQRIDVRYVYPSFSGLAPRDEEDGGDIYAPAGTRVRLRIRADRAVASGELALGTASKVSLRATGTQVLEGELTLARDDSYRVHLTDGDGLRGSGDTEYFIRVMDDRPPDVRIIRPSRDQQITPLEEVAIEARADDDYGISAFDLVYSVSGGPERAVRFPRVTGTDVQKTGSYLLPAEELGVQPGDVITYYARARDVGRGKRPTEAKSDMFFLEVKPFGEEFVAAQSQAGAGAGGTQLEALIAAQKEIINATWNIERRSAGGRSEADIKAIAQAQAELLAKVEQMGRGRGGAFREPFPQRLGADTSAQAPPIGQRPRGGDPMSAAIAAMAQAQQQLQSQRTRDAIPHEMAALNALLQAQAEVRRRQVAQQNANAGGGGSNRSGEDLSALFDKELQRQQRTNYETRSQVEERPDRAQSQDSALDRIRDLARRQEDLNRQQRELAGGNLSAEEMKRRLERLTREQEELRQQAEALAKQNARQGQGAAEMRDVSEQMRNATSDLRRQDAQSAAQKGERAAAQLRSLEQQARGGSPGGKAQAAGELQLEAQQIADAQRRVAAEAERLEREGTASADAKRRLADEKDRLAGRVDELQRATKQAGQADAARELERSQVGQRMRQTATQLRDGSQPTSAEEQHIARTLDQVSEKLGGAAGAEGQRLGEELKQTQAIRDRLNRLEQQMREAEARPTQGRGRKDGRAEGQKDGRAEAQKDGRAEGQKGGSARGRSGEEPGQRGKLETLRAEYQRELQRAREALSRLQQGEQRSGAGATPEQHEYSRSAPGTEQFKQDRSKWDSLRRDVDLALERHEAAVSDRLNTTAPADRLSAGASDRVPDKYRDLVAKYFQSLATGKRR
jgi:archaellum component FlaC